MMKSESLQNQAINAIRFLSADMVQQANSGHPGLPMGAAALAFTVWTRHLRHNPANPSWPNRDRFILSGGHGSALLYALLHLTGYDLPLDELKNFRQWGSRTPGHPEFGLTPGVETTTGPLGQGFANGVGMALAEAHLAAVFNRPGHAIVDHYTYAIVTDGDLMEGVSAEAASLAGHWQLGKLIYLYDDNRISIEGSTDVAFTEDRAQRFAAYGWQVLHVDDGNDVDAVDAAIRAAKADPRPSLIVCRTHIGYGLPHKQDTPKAHGEPPGDEELAAAKEQVGWPVEPRFYIPDDVRDFFHQALRRGAEQEADWQARFAAYHQAYPDLAAEFERRLKGQLPAGWEKSLPRFEPGLSLATRAASGKVLNAIAAAVPDLVGGSADLAPSNKTWLNDYPAFQKDTPQGRNIHFGVREHGMAAIVNGMAYHGGLRPYGATFLVFSDYMRGALRVASLSHLPVIWVLTHDSIGVGEDGPTHQPVEHLAALRAIPNLTVIRPADANETAAAWKVALESRGTPTALVLSRQGLPVLPFDGLPPVEKGAYVLRDADRTPDLILLASGSEVSLTLSAADVLTDEGLAVRVVSVPSLDLFAAQDKAYRERVLPTAVTARLAIEAGVSQGWWRWVGSRGDVLSIERYGASAPGKIVFEKFGFTVENVVRKAKELL